MKYFYLFIPALILSLLLQTQSEATNSNANFVIATKKIYLEKFPNAFNPSLIEMDNGFLLIFRHCLAPHQPWVSYIGIVLLDQFLEPISEPQLLNTPAKFSNSISQAEDARIFTYKNQIYITYNDNKEVHNPDYRYDRRNMFLAKLSYKRKKFFVENTIKLHYPEVYEERKIQKNWTPFEWKKHLLFVYSQEPHKILRPDLKTGLCEEIYNTPFPNDWGWGLLRGGTPAILIDGEYLSFFHSSTLTSTESSDGILMFHYYMGAYTFSAQPPFHVTKSSNFPIIGEGFYTRSNYEKRVIFPGGIVAKGPNIYVAYGKDDAEIWVAIIDKLALKKSLVKVEP